MVDEWHYGMRIGRSTLLMTVAAAAVVTALVAGGSVLFLKEYDRELVILKADPEPYKVRPSDPGGKKLDNLDSPVLGMLDPLSEKDTGREVLTPAESAPEPPPISVDKAVTAAPGAGEASAPAADGEAAPSEPPAGDEPTAVASAAETGEAAPPPEGEPAESAVSGAEAAAPAATAPQAKAPEASDDEIGDAVAQVTAPQPPADGEPLFVVQFAAFKSEKNATSTAAVLATKHAPRLDGVGIGHTRSGEFWRVVTDPMPRADASALCDKFRSVGQDCIVKLMEPPQ